MTDKNIKQFEKVVDLLKELDNDKISREFIKYYDIERREREELISRLEKQNKENQKSYLEIIKNRNLIHDSRIESENFAKHLADEYAHILSEKLSLLEKNIFTQPRKMGLLLIINGNKLFKIIKDVEQQNRHGVEQ